MKKSKTYIIIGIIAFLIYALYYDKHSSVRFNNLLDEKGVYTIGTIDKIEGLSKGGPLAHISYRYKNTRNEGQYIGDLSSVPTPHIGKHFFIKIVPDNPQIGIYFNPHCIAPDSILVAPFEGWSQEWMKEHFPECVR